MITLVSTGTPVDAVHVLSGRTINQQKAVPCLTDESLKSYNVKITVYLIMFATYIYD